MNFCQTPSAGNTYLMFSYSTLSHAWWMKEQNFAGEYLQGIERVGWGCVILLRSILTLSKTCDVDAKFAKEVSSSSRKGKMQMQLYRPSRLKSICKFKEEQVVDTLAWKRVSVEANIKAVQIHQLPKEHLRQWINPGYRYIRHQKKKK